MSVSSAVTWSPNPLLPFLLPSPSPLLHNGTSATSGRGDGLGVGAGDGCLAMVGVPDSAELSAQEARSANASWACPTDAAALNDSAYNASGSSGPSDCKLDQQGLYIFTQVLYALVCIIGLGGNTLVIYVVLRYSKMQTVTNMYIVNLAVADECFLIGIPFLLTTMNMQHWPFGDALCKLYMTTTSINQFTSSIFLTIMSADRYVAVCHPIRAPCVRTPFVSKVVSLVAWTASALLMIPILMYTTTVENSCNIYWPESQLVSGQTAFTLYSFVLGFFFPLMLIFVFYYLVIRRLRTVGPKHQQKKHAEATKSGNISADINSSASAAGGGASGDQRRRSHRKVTRLVLTVIAVYVFCWLPYWATQITLIFTPPKQCQSRLWVTTFLIAGCLSYSNSAVNPVLYAFLSDNFKKSFVKACTCKARSDINAALHLENSVFPRRNRKKRSQMQRRSLAMSSGNQPTATALAPFDGATEFRGAPATGGAADSAGGCFLGVGDGAGWRGGRLSSIEPSTAITMASRSNASADGREDEAAEEEVDVV
ncbi:somatostatin receptor type 5-like [Ischnura elegans]|uniref:somatostatin receptor type 5-like n=1 Tax=Ischnura elegans TaxID=197161 RepID=UPI001ED86BF1|nr:somatostatin receptor type 5-like [Ischnura elegans]